MTAIDWARDSGCDIINMSFGINTSAIPEVSLRRVKDTVNHAAVAGKIMFAAASNCGGNGGRAYPARDPNVICIYASDGKYFTCSKGVKVGQIFLTGGYGSLPTFPLQT